MQNLLLFHEIWQIMQNAIKNRMEEVIIGGLQKKIEKYIFF